MWSAARATLNQILPLYYTILYNNICSEGLIEYSILMVIFKAVVLLIIDSRYFYVMCVFFTVNRFFYPVDIQHNQFRVSFHASCCPPCPHSLGHYSRRVPGAFYSAVWYVLCEWPGVVQDKQAIRKAGLGWQGHKKSARHCTGVSVECTHAEIINPACGTAVLFLIIVLLYSSIAEAQIGTEHRINSNASNSERVPGRCDRASVQRHPGAFTMWSGPHFLEKE